MEWAQLLHFLNEIKHIVNDLIDFISGNTILMTMFIGSLLIIGAKSFKRIKNAVK